MVSTEEGAAFASSVGWPFFETSAKWRINITEAVEELIRRTPRLRGEEYRLVIEGAKGAGLTAMCVQFVLGHFVEDTHPLPLGSYYKKLVIKGIPKASDNKKAKGKCVEIK